MACAVHWCRSMPLSFQARPLVRSLFVFLFAAITLCSTPASAENAGPDRVTMRNGKTFQGTTHLVEVDAAFVEMTLDDGKVITIPSSEISRIERTVPDEKTNPRAPATSADDDEANAKDTGDVHVSFDADDGVALEQRNYNRDRWRDVCHGKCQIELPLDADYRVAGGGIRASAVFRLVGKDGDHIVLRPDTHSRGSFALGITLVSAGSFATLISLSVIGHCTSLDETCTGTRVDGAIAALVSAGVTLLGTILVATNPSSKVAQSLQGGAGSFLARSSSPSRGERTASTAEAARATLWHSTTPAFAPVAQASTLFTLHS